MDEAIPDWTTPSDQVSENGGVPVRATWIVPSFPEQIVPPPETTAEGGGVSETTRVELAVQVVGRVTVTPSVTAGPVGVNETDRGRRAPAEGPARDRPGVRGSRSRVGDRGRQAGGARAEAGRGGDGDGGERVDRDRRAPRPRSRRAAGAVVEGGDGVGPRRGGGDGAGAGARGADGLDERRRTR